MQLLPEGFDFAKSLPLQLCDFAWIAAVVALWTRHWAATALVYFWGLTLTVQGIVTPSLTDQFPHPQYFMFWGMHFFTVWAAVYLTFGLGARPTWRSYRFAVAATAAWAVGVMAFNAVTGTNYGYLNRKPAVGTLLDLFGPWPGYVVVEIAVVAVVWALMTWPWTRSAPRRGEPVRRRPDTLAALTVSGRRGAVPRSALRATAVAAAAGVTTGCVGAGDGADAPEVQALEIVVDSPTVFREPCLLNVDRVREGTHPVIVISERGPATVRMLDSDGTQVLEVRPVSQSEAGQASVRLEAGRTRSSANATVPLRPAPRLT